MSMQLQQNPLNDNSWLVTRQPSNASDPDDPFINLVKTLFENNIPTGKIDAVLNLIQDLSDLCIEFSKENDEKPAIDFKSYYDDIKNFLDNMFVEILSLPEGNKNQDKLAIALSKCCTNINGYMSKYDVEYLTSFDGNLYTKFEIEWRTRNEAIERIKDQNIAKERKNNLLENENRGFFGFLTNSNDSKKMLENEDYEENNQEVKRIGNDVNEDDDQKIQKKNNRCFPPKIPNFFFFFAIPLTILYLTTRFSKRCFQKNYISNFFFPYYSNYNMVIDS